MADRKMTAATLEGVTLIFRNFSGVEGRFNPPGRRTFSILLDPELGRQMEEDGWNVRWLKPREEGEEPNGHLPVRIRFDGRPPKVVLITSRGRSVLGENELSLLDWADIVNVDLIIRPYTPSQSGVEWVTAYLQSMYVTIEEDELERKYSEVSGHDAPWED